MPLRQTHTFVTLEVSPAAYREIEGKLRAAQYDHCFIAQDGETVIDMQGIALKVNANICAMCGGSGKRTLPTDPPQKIPCKGCHGTGSIEGFQQ